MTTSAARRAALLLVAFAAFATADGRVRAAVEAPAASAPEASAPLAPAAEVPAAAVPTELERRILALRREALEWRMKTVDWWLVAAALFLTALGVAAAFVGFVGFRRFREIEAEARRASEESRESAGEAARLVETIKRRAQEAETHLRSMTAAIAREHPEEARKAANEVRDDPDATVLDLAVADALSLQQAGKTSDAIGKWRAIANLAERFDKETAADAWFSIGYLLDDEENPDQRAIIDAYDKSIELNPNSPAAFCNRGNAKDELGQHEDAIADYDEAIRLNPDDAQVFNNRGIAKKNLGRHADAIADYEEAIRLKPDHAKAWFNRGLTNLVLGQKEDARRDLRKALELFRAAGDEENATDAQRELDQLDEQ